MSDISRETFDTRKHYTGVLMQQGRVQLDADWNEQQAIQQYRVETETRDVIGQCGAPMMGGGFKINFTPDHTDLIISPGRSYVDGTLCELEEGTPVPAVFEDANHVRVEFWQVDGQAFQKGQWIEFLGEKRRIFRLVEVDPANQVLTLFTNETNYSTTELQSMKNLRLRRITTYTTQPYYPTTAQSYPHPAFAIPDDMGLPVLRLHEDHFLLLVYLDAWKRQITSLDDPHIREVALGGSDTTTRMQAIWQVKILPIELREKFQETLTKHKDLEQQLAAIEKEEEQETADKDRSRKAIEDNRANLEQEIATFSSTLTCNSSFREWDDLTRASAATLNARTRPPDATGNPRYQRLENQLYRVEVDFESGEPGGPTFKWARDNAAVVALIESVGDNKVMVRGINLDDNGGFARGQWVELNNDQRELNGLRGDFVQIKDVDPITGALTLTELPPELDLTQHTKIRRWDGWGTIAEDGNWVDLESGVQVQFSPAAYKRGDYWVIPARTAISDVEWPPYEVPNLNPIPQPRAGIEHHYARLARVLLFKSVTVQDCRRRFPTLAPQAMHILGINWVNDDGYSREILKKGLHITLDASPDPHAVNGATMMVTLEPALPGHGDAAFIMGGHIEVEENNIYWRWGSDEEGGIAELLDKFNILFRGPKHAPRVRVILKGHLIWSIQDDHIFYLDGQTFAVPSVRSDGETPRQALAFPSGKGAQSSDFESWFYLTEL